MTPAARRATEQTVEPVAAVATPGHRRTVHSPRPAPRPRRVSGPAGGRAAERPRANAAPASPAAEPPVRTKRPARQKPAGRVTSPSRTQPLRPRVPRRVSGPATQRTLGARLLTTLRSLPDHPLLDRLIRGRTWIALLGFLLAGIVAMQVEVLKLGASMGRSIERTNMLQGRNETLRESVASLADDQRIMRLAAQRGMIMPAPSGVNFLSVRQFSSMARALAGIQAPQPSSFLARLEASGVSNNPLDPVSGSSSADTASGTGTASDTSTASGTTTSSGSGTSMGTGSSSGTGSSTGAASSTGSSSGTGTSSTGTSPSTGTAVSGSTGASTGTAAAGTAASATGGTATR